MVQPAGWSNSNWPSDVVKLFQSDAEDALAAGVPVLGVPVVALGLLEGDPDGPAAGPVDDHLGTVPATGSSVRAWRYTVANRCITVTVDAATSPHSAIACM